MWAVLVAEGLDIFWALRKGEGCLGGTGPVTAAIRGEGRGRTDIDGRKVGDRAIDGRGEASVDGNKWGAWLLIEKKGEGNEGEGKGTRHKTSHGEAIWLFWRDRRHPAGQTRFDAPRFIHSARLEASNRNTHCPSLYLGLVTAHCELVPLNQKKRARRKKK